MVLLEGTTKKKSQVTPPGIDPGTVRLVAQRLNHYATPGPGSGKYLVVIVASFKGGQTYARFKEDNVNDEKVKHKGKGKGHPMTCLCRHRGEGEIQLQPICNPALKRDEWPAPRSGRFAPGKDPVPNVQEVWWAVGVCLDGVEILVPTGIRSPDRPACSEPLY